jgi:hypothetical protein
MPNTPKDVSPPSDQWAVSERTLVPLGLAVTVMVFLLVNTAVIVWAASAGQSKITALETKVGSLEAVVSAGVQTNESKLSAAKQEYTQALERVTKEYATSLAKASTDYEARVIRVEQASDARLAAQEARAETLRARFDDYRREHDLAMLNARNDIARQASELLQMRQEVADMKKAKGGG